MKVTTQELGEGRFAQVETAAEQNGTRSAGYRHKGKQGVVAKKNLFSRALGGKLKRFATAG